MQMHMFWMCRWAQSWFWGAHAGRCLEHFHVAPFPLLSPFPALFHLESFPSFTLLVFVVPGFSDI